MSIKLYIYLLVAILGVAVLSGCASEKKAKSHRSTPKMSVSQELDLVSCSEGELRGAGLASDYDQALNSAVSQVATQIQSSVVSTSVMQVKSDVSAAGEESISSSFDRKSQVSIELRNRQDVHVRETFAHDGVVGVVACMSKSDAAKPYRDDLHKNRDELMAAVAVLLNTTHPLGKKDNYEKMTVAYSKYRDLLLVLQSLGFNENSAEIDNSYAKATENYINFKSKYKVYTYGDFETEEGKILLEQILGDIKLQSLNGSCEEGLVLDLDISSPTCKEGTLGVSCTESVALNGKSCNGETYFTLGGSLKGTGRFDLDEARAKLVKNASKNDFVQGWKYEIDRWIMR
ncbi:hypothetical protein [Fibrobacter sp. UBA4297]|uniref:hypothetical protein n=1 Tax=Fibrobacter sp. UBA4297 TaxID=1946536 RepID=UPI0025BC7711|nr:hypothetical protein [Fibrobacter sp. UBA4297]